MQGTVLGYVDTDVKGLNPYPPGEPYSLEKENYISTKWWRHIHIDKELEVLGLLPSFSIF